jgi:sulfite reductase (NADPH) flavoprotein alpha-component
MSIPLIPENAPFTAPQRAWLNGFFAGLRGGAQPVGQETPAFAVSATGIGAAVAEQPAADDADFPWHDPALPLAERLQLAEGKPLQHQLMAAMAQLDCGACGYLCHTYSGAIARGEERDLTRCSPGGNDTAKTLKRLLTISPPLNGDASTKAVNGNGHVSVATIPAAPKYSRANPLKARIHSVTRLTHADAPKDTRHVVIDLLDSDLTYEPGDALGICPVNCPDLVQGVLDQLAATGEESVLFSESERRLRDILSMDVALGRASPVLLELLANSAVDAEEQRQLGELAAADGGLLAGADVCEVLERFPSARLKLAEFVAALPKLQPRLYSISSSLRRHPRQVHLTVGVVRFESSGRWRNGVASHFLGVRSNPGDEVRVFLHSSPKFRLPTDPATPIVMVGPGTGIAPFIAFLQEREAAGAAGKNWLLFGNQHFEFDFLYREQLDRWADNGLLTRLDVAFSRDSTEKIYVQHRMLQQGAELWAWLDAGAHFYVCGDARRMAPDVDAALNQIVAEHGRMSREEAQAYITRLRKQNRYLKDVY